MVKDTNANEDKFKDSKFSMIKEDNSKESKYHQCKDCDFKSPYKKLLKKHMMKCGKYSCDQCTYNTNFKGSLKNHNESKHGGICYICELCIFNSNTRSKFLEHKKKVHGMKTQNVKMLKYPIPPKPVLSLKSKEVKAWFPLFFSKISLEIKAQRETGQPNPAWIKDIEDVISLNSLKLVAKNWDDIEQSFYWKLKLVSAIVLDHKGFDYTEFGMEIPIKHLRYSVTDLKMMSKAKNHSTFEKMFL